MHYLRDLSLRTNLALTAALSLLISCWQYATADIVSRDGVEYLEVALAYSEGGLDVAFELYHWPLYSILLSFLHAVVGYDLEILAYVVNGVLQALTCIYFVRIYALVDPDARNWWISSLIILTLPFFNEYRGDVMRGYGYWAFSLMFVYHFFAFLQKHDLRNALLCQFSGLSMIAFRPEGLVIVLSGMLPLLLRTELPFSRRLACLLKLYSIPIAAAGAVGIILFASQETRLTLQSYLPYQTVYLSADYLLGNFLTSVENLKNHVLIAKFSHEHAALILSAGLLAMLSWKLFVNLNVLYLIIGFHEYMKGRIVLSYPAKIVIYFVLVNALILIVFLHNRLFVVSRYMVLLVLLATIIMTMGVSNLINRIAAQEKPLWKVALSTCILVQFLFGVISTSASKEPIKEAGEHFALAIGSGKTLCNEKRLRYYSGLKCTYSDHDNVKRYFKKARRRGYDYLLLWLKEGTVEKYLLMAEKRRMSNIGAWRNRDGDTAVILEVRRK